MAIIEQLQHNPFDDSDYPDDYRPNSTWAIACDPSNVEGSYAADLAVAVEVVAPGDRVPCTRTPSTSSSSWRMGWPKSNSAPRPELFSPARSSLFRQERHTLAVRWAFQGPVPGGLPIAPDRNRDARPKSGAGNGRRSAAAGLHVGHPSGVRIPKLSHSDAHRAR
jgi:hypothetical protein